MNRYYSIPIPSRQLPRKIPNWTQNWRVSVSLSMRLCTLRIGILFLKDPGFRALVGLRDPFDDLCCVEGISIWSDRLRKARGSNGTGESIQKRQFFSILLVFSISIRLVLVSDPGSVSPFFRDELLAPVLHFVSVGRGERGSARRGFYHERSKEVNLVQIYNMDSGNAMECSWTLMSIRMNHLFHGGKSLLAILSSSKLQILSR